MDGLKLTDIKEEIKNIGYYKRPLLRDARVRNLVFIPSWILILLCLILPTSPNNDYSLFGILLITSILLTSLTIIVGGVWILLTGFDTKNNEPIYIEILAFIDSIVEKERKILEKYRLLEKLIEADLSEKWINPETVSSIKYRLQEITTLIQSIKETLESIKRKKGNSIVFNNEELYLYNMDLLKNTYQRNMVTFFNNFERLIKEWLSFHAEELEELEMDISTQAKQLWTEVYSSSALTLQWTRLENYINSLRQVQVTL